MALGAFVGELVLLSAAYYSFLGSDFHDTHPLPKLLFSLPSDAKSPSEGLEPGKWDMGKNNKLGIQGFI